MRIVAGDLRGRSIDAPAGEGTRPTIDRVREALFSSLYSMRGGFEGACVLDAFAGSGALGIEALSRGAERAVFYENDPKAVAVLKRNIASCDLSPDVASVVKRDVLATPPVHHVPPFDLVFLDPPYAYDAVRVLAMMSALAEAGALAAEAIVVYEHAKKQTIETRQAVEQSGFEIVASRKYGKTGITVMRMQENGDEA